MIRTGKAKNARTKRVMDNRAPKVIENPKQTLFVRGNKTGEVVNELLGDLHTLKKPLAVMYKKKNPVLPFDDSSSLEFFCNKSDTSLFVFGNHTKKRPNNVVLGRMFNGAILDMVEVGIVDYKGLKEYKKSIMMGSKPCFVFNGDSFETDSSMIRIKSLLLDLFKGQNVPDINIGGLEHVISVTHIPVTKKQGDGTNAVVQTIAFRVYKTKLLKSGSRIPRVELEEMGPNFDMELRRTQFPDKALIQHSMKQPAVLKPKKQKNVEYDSMGNKFSRVHMVRQDLDAIQLRKVKALKRKPEASAPVDKADNPRSVKKAKKGETPQQEVIDL
ncbi:hypothetical protein SARC_05566 [Sphaeroforma arctica JP610]|uniref:Ribosome production factor 2 homolog n=1 Tax=Sphaeroforma arctica JP610 TaxID=667725 RepID=A0A0L0G002_9EUKA|nr:hypothetical protein SARC_05566 [Sphaeroforma arctica JP610]KNC82146.1 hypothetical protein SARC_05566 [Sphaeroforma arctica JP610]|eukprot:XP_014156048.1 hypothetical protein SARC_05566 [Sphaeroforma arctica JP610]